MSNVSAWSTTAASNNAASPDGYPEGMAPSAVNNSDRETMAGVRSFYDSIEWRAWGHTISYVAATQFGTAGGDGDTTGIYHVGRRVHANGATTGDIYGTIAASAHSGTTTVTVAWDSGSLQNEALTVEVGFAVDQRAIEPSIESGSKCVFYQASAPTYWTLDAAVDDRMLIVDKDNGGTNGGSVSATSYTPTGTNANETTDHTHTVSGNTGPGPSASSALGGGSEHSTAGHTHAVSIATLGRSAAHTHTWTAGNAYTPNYAAVIVATKD